jgi:hypothetical protein
MNIFALDRDPRRAARWQCDRHVVKMTLETAQILCTVAHARGMVAPYRVTHAHHPCVLWAAGRSGNWRWLLEHGRALAAEYTRRYGHEHRSLAVIEWAARLPVPGDPGHRQPFIQVMPEPYRCRDSIVAYRRFYRAEKAAFATWKAPAKAPPWWDRVQRQ